MKADDEVHAAPAEYAVWHPAGAAAPIHYSLPAFHEIDFQVNEGYRRIPHGGVEIGGILWGRPVDGVVAIEAFRQIECEHASGPSFNLSARDIDGISDLIAKARSDDELRSLEPVGWFVAHTRSPLILTDRERELFDRFFPDPGKVTLLVKPERFQPTRFGFLIRTADGAVERDASSSAIILPLPGRAGKGVLPSIPAPAEKSPAAARPVDKAQPVRPAAPVPAPKAAEPPSVPEPRPAANPVAAPAPPQPQAPPQTQTPPQQRQPAPPPAPPALPPPVPRPPVAARTAASSASGFRLFLLLLLAAGLGCAVGYLAYMQLPPPIISLEAQKRNGKLLVQWPASQTRGVEYAAVRVDDGPPQLLTQTEKETGQMEVPRRSSVTKVEVIAQHWIRDSRGIVRFIAAEPAR